MAKKAIQVELRQRQSTGPKRALGGGESGETSPPGRRSTAESVRRTFCRLESSSQPANLTEFITGSMPVTFPRSTSHTTPVENKVSSLSESVPIISVSALEALVRTVRTLERRQPGSEEGVTPSCSTRSTPSRSPPARTEGDGAKSMSAVGSAAAAEASAAPPRAQLARGEAPSIADDSEGGTS